MVMDPQDLGAEPRKMRLPVIGTPAPAAAMADDDGLRPIFEHTATLGSKDLHLAVELAAQHGLDAPFAELGERWLRVALGLDREPDAQ